MTDDQFFISKLNEVSRKNGLVLPFLRDDQQPSSDFLAEWARFLEMVVKEGVPLSDPRWKRVTVKAHKPHTRFLLEPGTEDEADLDFRVGLQLLMGILGRGEESPTDR